MRIYFENQTILTTINTHQNILHPQYLLNQFLKTLTYLKQTVNCMYVKRFPNQHAKISNHVYYTNTHTHVRGYESTLTSESNIYKLKRFINLHTYIQYLLFPGRFIILISSSLIEFGTSQITLMLI